MIIDNNNDSINIIDTNIDNNIDSNNIARIIGTTTGFTGPHRPSGPTSA